MKTQYLRFAPDEEIPALACIRKRKLVKYYTRETLAAVLAVSRLLDGQPADTSSKLHRGADVIDAVAFARPVDARLQALPGDSHEFARQPFGLGEAGADGPCRFPEVAIQVHHDIHLD